MKGNSRATSKTGLEDRLKTVLHIRESSKTACWRAKAGSYNCMVMRSYVFSKEDKS